MEAMAELARATTAEAAEVNHRLQRYLSNGPDPSSGPTLRFDPVECLHVVVDEWRRHAAADRLFVCARRREHQPHCQAGEDTCDCDSDEALTVRSIRLEVHSNCRATLDLLLANNEGSTTAAPGLFPETARVFFLAPDKSNGSAFEREMALADIDPAPEAFVWTGLTNKRRAKAHQPHKKPASKGPAKPPQKPKAPEPDAKKLTAVDAKELAAVDAKSSNRPAEALGVEKRKLDEEDEFYGRLQLPGIGFELLESPRLSEAAISLQLDYMSFSQSENPV
jgi:hypothetical protein